MARKTISDAGGGVIEVNDDQAATVPGLEMLDGPGPIDLGDDPDGDIAGYDGPAGPVLYEDYVIVRGSDSGAFAGRLITRDRTEVTLGNARRLWYWDGAASLSELAVRGTSKPDQCKFPTPVPDHLVLDAIEVLAVTDQAQLSIRAVPEWTAH